MTRRSQKNSRYTITISEDEKAELLKAVDEYGFGNIGRFIFAAVNYYAGRKILTPITPPTPATEILHYCRHLCLMRQNCNSAGCPLMEIAKVNGWIELKEEKA